MKCNKCKQDVPLTNDAVALEHVIQHGKLPDSFTSFNYGSRHLLPTADCEGSPSRAQYLPGQPRDTRGYGYHQDLETQIRLGYSLLQVLAKQEAA